MVKMIKKEDFEKLEEKHEEEYHELKEKYIKQQEEKELFVKESEFTGEYDSIELIKISANKEIKPRKCRHSFSLAGDMTIRKLSNNPDNNPFWPKKYAEQVVIDVSNHWGILRGNNELGYYLDVLGNRHHIKGLQLTNLVRHYKQWWE